MRLREARGRQRRDMPPILAVKRRTRPVAIELVWCAPYDAYGVKPSEGLRRAAVAAPPVHCGARRIVRRQLRCPNDQISSRIF